MSIGGRKVKSWAAAASVVLALVAGPKAMAACNMRMMAELPLRLEAGALYTDVVVNGRDARAELSSGSQESAVAGWALAKLGLTQQATGANLVTVKGTGSAYYTLVPTMKLGAIVAKDAPFFVTGSPADKARGPEVILGSRFFVQSDVEFDLAHGKLRLFQPEGCKDDEVLYWGGAYSVTPLLANEEGYNKLRFTVQLNGQPTEAELVSGDSFSTLSAGAAAHAGGRPAPGAAVDYTYETVRPEIFNSFAIDQEAMKNVTLAVTTLNNRFASDNLGTRLGSNLYVRPLSLGADFIAAHRILVANSQRKLYLTYAGGRVFTIPTPDDGKAKTEAVAGAGATPP